MEMVDEKLTKGTHLKVVKNPDKPLELSALFTALKRLVQEKVPITALEAIIKEFNHCKKNGTKKEPFASFFDQSLFRPYE
jgi:hypothetical protein